jgi:hypothetical protein
VANLAIGESLKGLPLQAKRASISTKTKCQLKMDRRLQNPNILNQLAVQNRLMTPATKSGCGHQDSIDAHSRSTCI